MESKTVQPYAESEYRNLIQHDFPNLGIHAVRVIGSGEDRAAILINEDILFRLPRNIWSKADANDIQSTEKETGLYRALRLPFDVPQPSYIAPDKRYFGYPFLAGNRWADILGKRAPSDELLREWVKARQAISKAMTTLQAERLGVPRFDGNGYIDAVDILIKSDISAAMRNALRGDIDYLETYINRDIWEFTHNDLNAENILIDDNAHKITAVLDFGDTYIAPRSSDYYLWDKYPHHVMERIAQIAHEEDDDFDIGIARALHRVYVATDIMECRKAGWSKEAEQGYWSELERCYEVKWQ